MKESSLITQRWLSVLSFPLILLCFASTAHIHHLQPSFIESKRCNNAPTTTKQSNSIQCTFAFSPSYVQSPPHRTKIKPISEQMTQHAYTSIPSKLTKDDDEEEAQLITQFSTLRSLGIDYGLSRTGLAVTTGGYRPRPLAILSGYTKQYTLRNITKIEQITGRINATVSGLDNTRLIHAIVNYAQSERVSNLVLGLPLHKNGSISEQSNITRMFGMELLRHVRRECGTYMNVTLWDERYSSKEAASRIVGEAMARNRDLSTMDLGGCLDDEAACVILEHYYQVLGKDAEVLTLDDLVEEECGEAYRLKMEGEERERLSVLEERERRGNARREMIERDRRLQELEGGAGGGGKKKKKRKKKK